MPRYDAHHETVKTALRKDGWTITDDPFTIYVGKTRLYADLGAEKEARLIVVEIKGFEGDSFVNELHRATGQYANYRSLLRGAPQSDEIYLAIPPDVYSKYFHRELVTTIIKDQQIKFFTYSGFQMGATCNQAPRVSSPTVRKGWPRHRSLPDGRATDTKGRTRLQTAI